MNFSRRRQIVVNSCTKDDFEVLRIKRLTAKLVNFDQSSTPFGLKSALG